MKLWTASGESLDIFIAQATVIRAYVLHLHKQIQQHIDQYGQEAVDLTLQMFALLNP